MTLDELNDLFLTGSLQESHITINKRRETTVKKLVFVIQTITGKSNSEVLIKRRNSVDKRIREIKLGVEIKIIEN